ncbi:MAG TPA: phosphonate ABC transporter ATP-binding protein [Pyrinomonadaceae bacterium]|nr:phosphonate ABC transporter ATP-binding protein [Pyrinomonadaceae bacterium]
MVYRLEQVSKEYRSRESVTRALDGLSLSVERGERVALLGPSGAGKTTLFRLLNATLRPTRGRLLFDGRDVGAMSARELRAMRSRVGTVYQQHYLVPSLSVLDNALCGRLGRWSLWQTARSVLRPARADVREAEHVLELVGLKEKLRERADALSGGQQQRLAVARVLMQRPDVILADEPVASLDPGLADSIMGLLRRVADEGGRTLLVALHNVELALSYFPRVVGLRAGAVAFDADASALNRDALGEFYQDERAPSGASGESEWRRTPAT